jgi:hypothetical protein
VIDGFANRASSSWSHRQNARGVVDCRAVAVSLSLVLIPSLSLARRPDWSKHMNALRMVDELAALRRIVLSDSLFDDEM